MVLIQCWNLDATQSIMSEMQELFLNLNMLTHYAALVKFNLQFLFCFILQILLHVLILLILNAAYLANSYLTLSLPSVLLQITFFLHIAFFIFNRYFSVQARSRSKKSNKRQSNNWRNLPFYLIRPWTDFKYTQSLRFRKITGQLVNDCPLIISFGQNFQSKKFLILTCFIIMKFVITSLESIKIVPFFF